MFQRIHQALLCNDPTQKCVLTGQLYADARQQGFDSSDAAQSPVVSIPVPGRPEKPELIPPRFTKNRPLSTQRGRKTLLHAVTHIEFNAINLALDAAWRFRDMPDQYYLDWLSVAADEARHFQLLEARMAKLELAYGDLAAHNGLWNAACETDHDVMVRMALVPRVLEARGLDVTPGMIEKLKAAEDHESVAALELILQEEVGHVDIGSRWFRYCCEQRGLSMQETFISLIRENRNGAIRGPYNYEARKQGGFTDWELEQLEALFHKQ